MKAEERVESSLLDLVSYSRLVRDDSSRGKESEWCGRRKRLNLARSANFVCLARLEKRAYISRERLLIIEMYRKRDSDESEN